MFSFCEFCRTSKIRGRQNRLGADLKRGGECVVQRRAPLRRGFARDGKPGFAFPWRASHVWARGSSCIAPEWGKVLALLVLEPLWRRALARGRTGRGGSQGRALISAGLGGGVSSVLFDAVSSTVLFLVVSGLT